MDLVLFTHSKQNPQGRVCDLRWLESMRHISAWLAPAAEWASTKSQRHLHSRAPKDRAEWNTLLPASSTERIYDYWQITTPCKQINAEKKWMSNPNRSIWFARRNLCSCRVSLCVSVRCDACNKVVVSSCTNQQKGWVQIIGLPLSHCWALNKNLYL